MLNFVHRIDANHWLDGMVYKRPSIQLNSLNRHIECRAQCTRTMLNVSSWADRMPITSTTITATKKKTGMKPKLFGCLDFHRNQFQREEKTFNIQHIIRLVELILSWRLNFQHGFGDWREMRASNMEKTKESHYVCGKWKASVHRTFVQLVMFEPVYLPLSPKRLIRSGPILFTRMPIFRVSVLPYKLSVARAHDPKSIYRDWNWTGARVKSNRQEIIERKKPPQPCNLIWKVSNENELSVDKMDRHTGRKCCKH